MRQVGTLPIRKQVPASRCWGCREKRLGGPAKEPSGPIGDKRWEEMKKIAGEGQEWAGRALQLLASGGRDGARPTHSLPKTLPLPSPAALPSPLMPESPASASLSEAPHSRERGGTKGEGPREEGRGKRRGQGGAEDQAQPVTLAFGPGDSTAL